MNTMLKRAERPRVADLFDWFDTGFIPAAWSSLTETHTMRVEDYVADDMYVLKAELPGMDADSVEVTVDADVLTIVAERREEEHEGGRSEFRYGRFSRSVTLPPGAREDGIVAKFAEGILKVTVPLDSEPPKEHKIPVQHGS